MWRMRKILAVLALVVPPQAALAGGIGDLIAARCGSELTAHGQSACLGVLTDERMTAMNRTLAGLPAQIQGADARTLRAFDRDIRRAQRVWRQSMEADCRAATGLTAGPRRNLVWRLCLLQKTMRRKDELTGIIRLAFEHLGGAPGGVSYVPDEVEVFIPLGGLKRHGERVGVYFGVPLNHRPFN